MFEYFFAHFVRNEAIAIDFGESSDCTFGLNEYDKYFKENRKEGITTFQDLEVEELLSKR